MAAKKSTQKRVPPSTQVKKVKTRVKRKLIRNAIFIVNLVVVGVATYVVVAHSNSNAANYVISKDSSDVQTSPLDTINAADIAVNVARMANMPEAAAVTNYADTVNAELETFTVVRDVATIPQILTLNIKTLADIQTYETVEGDTLSGLATKFGVTSDSIRWSNDVTENELPSGIKLLIPPMNGIIYVVRSGDTIEKVAQGYGVSASQIISFNDLEVGGFTPGVRIFLPNAVRPTTRLVSFRYGWNGYDYGYCTYYAAAKAGAPPGWGHAKTWAINAARTPGWTVSKIPVPGSIAQNPGMSWWGHVAVVEAVKEEDGQYWIKYSDMNNLAGWNRIGYTSDWRPASEYPSYIIKL